jgi:hypothetical protein
MKNNILRTLMGESFMLKRSLPRLEALYWSDEKKFLLRYSDLAEFMEIRKWSKDLIVQSYKHIRANTVPSCSNLEAMVNKIKGIMADDPIRIVERYKVYLMQSATYISVLEGKHRVSALLINNALKNNISIENTEVTLNCFLGREISK